MHFISMSGLYLGRELREFLPKHSISPTVSGETNSFSNLFIVYQKSYAALRVLEGSMRTAGPMVEVNVSLRK